MKVNRFLRKLKGFGNYLVLNFSNFIKWEIPVSTLPILR